MMVRISQIKGVDARIGSLACIGILGLFAAGCSQDQRHFAAAGNKFPQSIYGPASPRVVADGEPVPKGGGTYMVGKPYTVAGHTYYPSEKPSYTAVGLASWYGADFHGRKTANGEVFDADSISAAHPTMPLPSYARVTNLRNHRSIIVRVNDRGPYHGHRLMDVSEKVADALGFQRIGTATVKVEYVGRASLAGSDDRMLLASLRTDGVPATLGSPSSEPVMVAENQQPKLQKMAALEPAVEQQAGNQSTAEVAPLVTTVAQPALAPRPPARPFDLGAIRNVIAPPAPPPVPVFRTAAITAPAPRTAAVTRNVPLPPVFDHGRLTALYYTDDLPPIAKFEKNGPFRKFQP